jgi:hypothetical protein
MTQHNRRVVIVAVVVLTVLVLAALFIQRAYYNLTHEDFRNTNFFFFWLAGRMVLIGQNPYDSVQWLAGHDAFGNTWRPNQIFPYPLPLAFLMAPLGLLSLPAAYFTWQVVCEVFIAVSVWYLLQHWFGGRQSRLFPPLMIFLMFFGPVYLSLQIGSLAPLTLIILVAALALVERGCSAPAGILLSLTILKPPQGLTLLALAAVWLLARRDWRAIAGIAIGGLALLTAGLLKDPQWIGKFGAASQVVLDRTLGIQSNVFSFAYLACGRSLGCMWILGSAAMLLIVGLTSFYLWKQADTLSPWDAFNLIIPIGFVSTVYLWSYDQLPYIIPILWIAGTLVERTRSYIPTFALIIVLVLVSFTGLVFEAYTHSDLLSVFPTVVVIGLCLWLFGSRPPQATASAPAAQEMA